MVPLLLAAFLAAAPPEATRLIKLNIVATEAKGEPVTDLAPAELTVKEDGHPRQIVFFRHAGPHASNAPTVLVLDRWNERLTTTATSANEIRDALKLLHPDDPVYLFFFDPKGNVVPVRPLPGLEAGGQDDPSTAARRMLSGLDRAIKDSQGFRARDSKDPFERVNITLRDLDALGAQLAPIAGRKNVLWVTHGVPNNIQLQDGTWFDMSPQLRRVAANFARAQIAIYAVGQSGEGAGADLAGESRQGLQVLAGLTGGRWSSSDSTAAALRSALTDMRNYYTIAYYSPFTDRKAHKIRVESNRKTAHILSRDGYDPEPDADPAALEMAAFQAAQSTPLEATEIGVTVVSSAPGKVVLRIEPSDVMIDARNHAHLSILAGQTGQKIDPEVSPQGIVIEQKPAPRYFVYDRTLRALGSVTVKLP
jgi:VWFA-related protein